MNIVASDENIIDQFLIFVRKLKNKLQLKQLDENKEEQHFEMTYDNKQEKSPSQIESGIKSQLYNNLKFEDLEQAESLAVKIRSNVFPQNFLMPICIQNQTQKCQDISFNKDNSLMASTKDNTIIIWKFDGKQIIETQTLQGHDNDVACLQFSQKTQNTLISGGGQFDGKIVVWQQKEKSQPWIKMKYLTPSEQGGIRCMVFSKKEDYLFVGESNGYISIYHMMNQCQQVRLIQPRTQCFDSNKQCFGISLNDSEQQFISCHQTNFLVLWQKFDEWVPIQQIVDPNFVSFGCRIKFLDQFIIFQDQLGYLNFLQQINDSYQFIDVKRMRLDDQEKDYFNFPIFYIPQKRILIVKHNKFVHFLKRDNQNNFTKLDFIAESNSQLYGKVSEDGKYLGTWCQEKLKIYDLTYMQN